MNILNKLLIKKFKQYPLLLIGIISLVLGNCGSQKSINSSKQSGNNYNTRRFLLRDEGMSQLCYLDMANAKANWYLPVPPGRDMQIVGKGRVLIGTGTGYEEREITNGKKVYELTSFTGTLAARRLRNGNTLLTGVNWQGKQGIVLVEVNGAGAVQRLTTYPGFDYVRLVRETATGNFLITADNTVFEGTSSGSIVWQVKITGAVKVHTWQALRLANGNTIVSSGYAKNFQIFSADGKLVDTISGPAQVNPNFYAGFQILANGNYVVTNWQGHGPKFGASGTQLLEYTPDGKLAWSWQQDSTKFSSLQGVIVLNGLDLNSLLVEDASGKLTSVAGR